MADEIQRAQLFRDVDELIAWKKTFELRQTELITWQASVMASITDLQQASKNTLEGCRLLIETDTSISQRIDDAWKRIDIVNIRLRKLEDVK